MTVIAVGTDIVDIPTFRAQLELPGSRLPEVFTSRERRRAGRRAAESGSADSDRPSGQAQHLAAVWAIKEAFIKAWSGALRGSPPPLPPDDVNWAEIEVRHDRWGRPGISLHGKVADAVNQSLGIDHGQKDRFLASASHDGDVACALVLLQGP